MKTLKKYIFTLGLILIMLVCGFTNTLSAQTTIIMRSNTTTLYQNMVAGQTYYIYDPGGTGDYQNGLNSTLRLTAPAGHIIILQVSYTTEYSYDKLYIYNSTVQSAANLIGVYTGSGNADVESNSNIVTINFQTDYSQVASGFVITATACQPVLSTPTINTIDTNNVTMHWQNAVATGTTIRWGTNPNLLTQQNVLSGTSFTFPPLRSSTTYYYNISSSIGCPINGSFRTPCINSYCPDFTDLNGCNVTAYYGVFNNPSQYVGVVNDGSSSMYSRHTVHYNRTETDYRTLNQLHCVPPGENASVRLGNWRTGSEAERLVYEYVVDTTHYDMLVLKYAAVLQNPGHSSVQQPRFTFRIHDANGQSINQSCYSADFIANANLGWHTNGYVLWKDWTNVGVNLSPLHGQTIYIELTTYDCSQGAHYGYAYFVLKCANKRMASTNCGNTVSNTFSAPEGFNYRWYEESAPNVTLSTSKSLYVNRAGTYKCWLSFVSATSTQCGFEMTANAGTRYPASRFVTTMDTVDCNFNIHFINRSVIAKDEAHTQLTNEPCETALWVFDDGTTSSEINPTHTLSAGIHEVKLISTIAGGHCSDTLVQQLVLMNPCLNFDTVSREICRSSLPFTFHGQAIDSAGVFTVTTNQTDFHTLILAVHDEDTLAINDTVVQNQLPVSHFGRLFTQSISDTAFHFVNRFGCDSTVQYSLHVWENKYTDIDTAVCANSAPLAWHGRTFNVSASDSVVLTGAHGEDSTLRLTVTINPTSLDTIYDTVVQNALPRTFSGSLFSNDTANHLFHYSNIYGCDSTLNYNLKVWHNLVAHQDTTLCQDQTPFTWHGKTFSSSALDSVVYRAAHGEDSTIFLTINVNPTNRVSVFDTTVENLLPHTYVNTRLFNDTANAAYLFSNRFGCDSLVDYNLKVWRNLRTSLDTAVCNGTLPTVWHTRTFADAGIDSLIILGQHGEDSTLLLNLTINPTSLDTIYDTVVQNALPRTFSGSLFSNDTANHLFHYSNIYGCDSTLNYNLKVWHNLVAHQDTTLCQDQTPFTWHGKTFSTSALDSVVYRAAHGEDSTIFLTINVNPTNRVSVFDTTVENLLPHTYVNTRLFNDTANAAYLFSNRFGCDSLVDYNLKVWRNLRTSLDTAVCNGTLPTVWHTRTFADAGIDSLIILGQHGEDSTLILNLTINPTSLDTIYDTVVQNALPRRYAGINIYNDTNNRLFHFTNRYGCDSTINYNLKVWRNHVRTLDTAICQTAAPLTWHGRTFNTTARDSLHLRAMHGEDSLVILNVTVYQTVLTTVNDTTVENNLPHLYVGTSYTADTTHARYTFTDRFGCDSLVDYNLKVWRNLRTSLDTAVCNGTLPTVWHTRTFTGAGNDSLTIFGQHGEDSTLLLTLTVLPTHARTHRDTVVQNQLPVHFAGCTFAHDVTDTCIHLTNIYGCDSAITYSLHVWHNLHTERDTAICQTEAPLTWYGKNFYVTSRDSVTLTAIHGEDSTLGLNVTVHTTQYSYDTVYIVENQLPYTYDQTVLLDSTELQTITYTDRYGCDSIANVTLRVYRNVQTTIDMELCTGSLPYRWHDISITHDGSYSATLRGMHGEDSVVTAIVRIYASRTTVLHDTICEGDAVIINDHKYIATGHYIDSLVTQDRCDSLVILNLKVYPTYHNTHDEVICQGESLNFCGALYSVAGTYNVPYRALGNCDSIETLRLQVGVPPIPSVRVEPEFATIEHRNIRLADRSKRSVSREWWVCGMYDTAAVTHFDYPTEQDSVEVQLRTKERLGCAADTSFYVMLKRDDPWAPNAFTPDLATNNCFYITGYGLVDVEVFIYRRDGLFIHSWKGLDGCWDGRNQQGEKMAQGTYVFLVRYATKSDPRQTKTFKGTVTLLR